MDIVSHLRGDVKKGTIMTQNEMVLNHLCKYGSITPKDAEELYGIMRLGARIYDLKQSGHSVQTKMESSKNRFGVTVSYARYYLKEVQNSGKGVHEGREDSVSGSGS